MINIWKNLEKFILMKSYKFLKINYIKISDYIILL